MAPEGRAGMFYVISPPESTDWHLDHDAFARDLVSEWPRAKISSPEPDAPTRSLVWSIEDPEGGSNWLEGTLDRAGQAHFLRGDLTLAAEFAHWLRQKVDPAQRLVFFDEAFTHVIPLSDDDSAARIVRAFATF